MRTFIILTTLIVLFFLISSLQGSQLLFGGEANYFLDYRTVQSLYRSTWLSIGSGTGAVNPILNQTAGLFDFFSFLQNINIPYNIINLVTIYLIYALPFLSMFFLSFKVLKINFKTAFIVSLFYILNPFFVINANFTVFWAIAPFIVLPLTFAILYKFFFNGYRLFFIFGIFTAIVSFSFANIPYLGIFHMFLPISLIIISYMHSSKFQVRKVFLNYLLILMSFVLFNLWWFAPLVRFQIQDSKTTNIAYTKEYATTYAINVSAGKGTTLNKVMTLKPTISEENYFFFNFYNSLFVHGILLIPLMIILFSLIFYRDRFKSPFTITIGILLLVFFLNKGFNEPLRWIYVFLIDKIPFFLIFKTPLEKFSVLSVFLLSLSIILTLKKCKTFHYLLGVYLIVCAIPYVTLNLLPDYKIHENKYVSRIFVDKPEYRQIAKIINKGDKTQRLLSLPGSLNYQITMHTYANKFYRGMDPIMYELNRSFIGAYSGAQFSIIFNNIKNQSFSKILGLFAIDKILVNKDIYPSFGFKEKESIVQIDKILSKYMAKQQLGPFSLYSNPYILDRIYAPETLLFSDKYHDSLPQIINANTTITDKPFGIFFWNDNKNVTKPTTKALTKKIIESPKISFSNINPSHYSVVVRNAKKQFFLIFSETYHPLWKLYAIPNEESSDKNININPLKRITEMIKPTQRYEIAINEHYKVNTYANLWAVNPNQVCKLIHCDNNLRGKSFNLLIQFEPQLLFNRVVIISAIIFIIGLCFSLIYLLSKLLSSKKPPRGPYAIQKESLSNDLIDHKAVSYFRMIINETGNKKIVNGLLLLVVYVLSKGLLSPELWMVTQFIVWTVLLIYTHLFSILFSLIKQSIKDSHLSKEQILKRTILLIVWNIGIIMVRRVGITNVHLDIGTALFLMYLPSVLLLKMSETITISFALATLIFNFLLFVNGFRASAEIIATLTYYLILIGVVQRLIKHHLIFS